MHPLRSIPLALKNSRDGKAACTTLGIFDESGASGYGPMAVGGTLAVCAPDLCLTYVFHLGITLNG
jgi:hypothetical protein